MLPRIIGLAGKKGAGKDTVGSILAEYNYERISFATPLKESAAALFGIPVEDWEKYKNNPDIHVGVYQDIDNEYSVRLAGGTARQFLQRYGTEAHRDIFGASFWTDQLIQKVTHRYDTQFVITDARFENECAAIRDIGGIIIEVQRPDIEDGDTHASEKPIPRELVDATINNFGTIEDLELTVERFVAYGINFNLMPR